MKIGEVAQTAGVSTKTIRFYEDSGLLAPPGRTSSGYRCYDAEAAGRLRFIRRCQAAGLSLADTGEILRLHDSGEDLCGRVKQTLTDRLEQVRERITELRALEAHLAAMLDYAQRDQAARHAETDFCWILESGPDPIAIPNPHNMNGITPRHPNSADQAARPGAPAGVQATQTSRRTSSTI